MTKMWSFWKKRLQVQMQWGKINFCVFSSEKPDPPIITVDIQATSIKVNWSQPAGDGGSPITAYRLLILHGDIEIRNETITDLSTQQIVVGGLTNSTNYTVRVFARNSVFEGNPAEKKIQTKFEGKRLNIDIFFFPHKRLLNTRQR